MLARYITVPDAGHHIEHWATGGETALASLMLLCSAHYTPLHEGGCRVGATSANGAGGWNFFDHRNRRIDANSPRNIKRSWRATWPPSVA